MAHSAQTLSERLLIDIVASLTPLPCWQLDRASRLMDLEVSEHDFIALVGALEARCDRLVPDLELARCETLGDLVDRLIPGVAPAEGLRLDSGPHEEADTGCHGHGQSAPESHSGGRPPRCRATGPGTGHAQQRQAG